uniref:Uncharacterized protein n=1 Tax=Romanomermis culicivorax TaxID=13658 RepID=A0A915IMH5_ROMCU
MVGFKILLGSKVFFKDFIKAKVVDPNSCSKYRFLPKPIPCSPEQVPPAFKANLKKMKILNLFHEVRL